LTAGRGSRRRLWRLDTKTSIEGQNPVLFVEGRLGHDAAAELEAAVHRHLSDAAGDVIIDMSGVDYVSSAPLKLFAALADRLSEKGGRLRLREPSVSARLALELAGLQALVDSA
jgi:anti-anti-sigma factor